MLKLQAKKDPKNSIWLVGPQVTVGNARGNNLILNHPGIEALHVELAVEGDNVFITDKSGSRSVIVNGRQVQRHQRLSIGDIIRVNTVELELVDPMGTSTSSSSRRAKRSSKSSVVGGGSLDVENNATALQPRALDPDQQSMSVTDSAVSRDRVKDENRFLAAASQSMMTEPFSGSAASQQSESLGSKKARRVNAPEPGQWVLRAANGDIEGQEFSIAPTTMPTVIGRSGDCDIVIPGPYLSRRHAELSVVPGGINVKDLNSSNGTFINDERVVEALVGEGDKLRFDVLAFELTGPVHAEVEDEDEEEDDPTIMLSSLRPNNVPADTIIAATPASADTVIAATPADTIVSHTSRSNINAAAVSRETDEALEGETLFESHVDNKAGADGVWAVNDLEPDVVNDQTVLSALDTLVQPERPPANSSSDASSSPKLLSGLGQNQIKAIVAGVVVISIAAFAAAVVFL